MNSQAIKEAIQWLIEHPEDAKRMGKNGRKAIESKYNWEKESKTLLELYEAIR
jgi:glycosyltransferase involved in cell wall biosynthesis